MATSLNIDDALRDRIEQLANRRDTTPHRILHEAVNQYVDREDARDSFGQEAVASLCAYRATGRHLTGDEVAAWLAGWGTEDEVEPPECHG